MTTPQHDRGASLAPTIPVRDARVPALGLGTWQLEGDACQRVVETALELGYRHFDTARQYDNEDAVGRALVRSVLPREELFLTTKIFLDDLARDRATRAVEDSVTRLRTEYLDLVLIHWPSGSVPFEETLDALQEVQRAGLVKHVGVSNFTPSQLEHAARRNPLLCNRVEYHPFLAQDRLLAECRRLGMLLVAYSPLAHGRVVDDPTLARIGGRHGRTPAQIALRWLVQQEDVAAVPKASSREHLEQNLAVFDFELGRDEVAAVSDLARGERVVDPDFAPTWER